MNGSFLFEYNYSSPWANKALVLKGAKLLSYNSYHVLPFHIRQQLEEVCLSLLIFFIEMCIQADQTKLIPVVMTHIKMTSLRLSHLPISHTVHIVLPVSQINIFFFAPKSNIMFAA